MLGVSHDAVDGDVQEDINVYNSSTPPHEHDTSSRRSDALEKRCLVDDEAI